MSEAHKPDLDRTNIVAFLEDIFDRRGGEEYLGEPVTMAEHMLQSAHFAEAAGEPPIVIAAALLHDVGHFTSEFGMFSMDDTEDRYHEEAGADVLAQFFPPLVVNCVRYHVAAKRYLCATDESYFSKLSDASVHSLNLQGGPMNEDEVSEFEKLEDLPAVIRVRHYDEAGKEAGMATKPFSAYRDLLQNIVDAA